MRTKSGHILFESAPAIGSRVFKRSYLPYNINANLLHITFQGLASSTQAILKATRTAFLRRDKKAPVYIT
ncbi:unnamed protein product [Clonostachys solani]|uniref:Uncharacterized protein n=1 Tax=Clonostachys solani TaxID=160281 RepID=A0A9P0EKK6_9HYPO|nr:unnamed protein product [Clonostachys solani]